MRRIVAALLALCLIAVLAGCRGSQTDGAPVPKSADAEQGHPPYALKLLAQISPNKKTAYQKLVDAFLERYPYFTVTVDTATDSDEMEQMAAKTDYDVLFFEESEVAAKLYDREELAELEEFYRDNGMEDKISNLILPQWELRYAIPLFLKVNCIFLDADQICQEPVDYIAWLAEHQPEKLKTTVCTGLVTGTDQTAVIDCTCVALGSRGDRKNGEFFLQTLYREDFLPECITQTGLPLACRVTLAEAELPAVTVSVYQRLADADIRLQFGR